MRLETPESVGGLPRALIELGKSGYHPLFSNRAIRRAFKKIGNGLLREERLLAAHKALRRISPFTEIQDIKDDLLALEEDTYDLIIYFYFRSLEKIIESDNQIDYH
ncbi:hypothetical protein KKF91_15830 [Myxococcota bacterium]|nr:hypothetical protein [Myxococcota bacterium]MBU1432011.1 hypothetical protein [Myxococcota bacterium]